MIYEEALSLDKPMLQCTLRDVDAELAISRTCEAQTARELGLSGLRTSDSARAHATLRLDAAYLNLNVNQLEPLVEPWEGNALAVVPPGARLVTTKVSSRRLLHGRLLAFAHRCAARGGTQ